MKSIVLSIGLYITALAVSLGILYYIEFEQVRSSTLSALKRSLEETMEQVEKLDVDKREEEVMIIFNRMIGPNLRRGYDYTIDFTGFNADPLAVRIQIYYVQNNGIFEIHHRLDETMIEVEP